MPPGLQLFFLPPTPFWLSNIPVSFPGLPPYYSVSYSPLPFSNLSYACQLLLNSHPFLACHLCFHLATPLLTFHTFLNFPLPFRAWILVFSLQSCFFACNPVVSLALPFHPYFNLIPSSLPYSSSHPLLSFYSFLDSNLLLASHPCFGVLWRAALQLGYFRFWKTHLRGCWSHFLTAGCLQGNCWERLHLEFNQAQNIQKCLSNSIILLLICQPDVCAGKHGEKW